ncbi:MAG: class 1 fructose-bisphosphatase [Nitrospinae bacterium]|nr:class 1 fructose-bisphosphatase [Nitrospinota bacterium]
MSTQGITLQRHVLELQHTHPHLVGEVLTVLTQVAFAAKIISREMRRAALVGKLGLVGEKNPTGDAQKKLDVFGNETIVGAFAETGLVAAIVSEELDEAKHIVGGRDAKYVLCVDPLDGSSNTDINGPVGTIFGIYRRVTTGPHETARDLLRKGSEQVAAGYAMYGPSTILVYTCGDGVTGFTLDLDLGEFLLSHENIRCPPQGHYYSANLGHYHEWHPNIQQFVEYVTGHDPATHRPYSLRYTGALVADVHRSLLEGGLYFYPPDMEHKEGKLRYLYECAPLALVVEQAGGQASTGTQRILDMRAESIHQRVPLVLGSTEDVARYETFVRDGHL